MIIDLARFLHAERPFWRELEDRLDNLEADPYCDLGLAGARRLHYLYQRACSGLARLQASASEPEIRGYLEALVARAYGEIHESRARADHLSPARLLARDFPRAFRRHIGAFFLACLIALGGAALGGLAVVADPDAREAVLPADLAANRPTGRVRDEESRLEDRLHDTRSTFSAALATHNIRVAFLCLALGVTWGIGTALLIFYNGIILGAVAADYVGAGQTTFLLGWLLPHGAIEIPAFLIAGQAGLVLAGALIGRGEAAPAAVRLRRAGRDLVALAAGLVVLLVWAGIVEAFLSQYHEPVLPYAVKIAFGIAEAILLAAFLVFVGRRRP